ncbi:MAG: hypothetical protein QNJ33_03885 [Crocosphaera sp.]|nr:hypothetical protein [Crocosphaera sp.]
MKHSHMLAGLALGLSLLGISPAQAEPAQKEVLISQLAGHELEDPIDVYRKDWLDFKFDEYIIGRIRGVTGDVAQIQIISAGITKDAHVRVTHDVGFTTGERDVWHVTAQMPHLWPNLVAGSDVIMKVVDDKFVIISDKRSYYRAQQVYARPYWVSRLDLREVPEVKRTNISWDRPDVSLPPLEENQAEIAPPPEPVPGMW